MRAATKAESTADGSGVFPDLIQDARHGLRLLKREPGFAFVAILTIALGIGATTTLFSVAYGVLMKPLSWPNADRIMRVTEMRKGQPARIRGTITNGAYLAWRDRTSTTEAIGGYSIANNSVTASRPGGEPVRLAVAPVTPALFDVLQARPLRGRLFTNADAPEGGSGAPPDRHAVILSYGLWQDWFGGRDDALGSVFRLDEMPVTVVGIMPRDFAFPNRETRAWTPMAVGGVLGDQGVRRIMIFGALARLRPGASPQQASIEATTRARTAPDPGMAAVAMFGSDAPAEVIVTPAVEAMTAEVRPAIVLLLAAVALLLATAAANVGSLQLARATARRREIAVRAAIGAGRARLMRQLLVESALIGFGGGIAGLVLTAALHRALPSLLPPDFPRADAIAINAPVLAFAVLVSVATSIACGLLPAVPAARIDLAEALAEDSAASTGGTWRTRAGRLRTIIMAGQVAVACVLLIGAALLGRSFSAMLQADRGYDPTNVLTARVDLPQRYDGPRRVQFADAVLARVGATPGVAHVAAGNALPFVSLGSGVGFEMPSPTDPAVKQQVQATLRSVSPDYFRALGLRLVAGRLLADSDSAATSPVVVVNRSFARRYLGEAPLGMRVPLRFERGRSQVEVVGVVDDMHQSSVADPSAPELFVSYRQVPAWMVRGALIFVARTVDDPLAHVATLRAAVRELDPAVVLDDVMTMDQRVRSSLARPRLYAVLLTMLALAAAAIAGVGLFGVLSYAVAQRAREIGVRTALGATPGRIVRLVLRQVVAIAATGTAIGFAVALVATRSLATFLYGVGEHDAVSFVAVAVLLAIVSAAAAVVPARRAARVDPLTALRSA